MAFVTSNIILMPFLGAALTTIIAMMGQMIMGILSIISVCWVHLKQNNIT